MAATWTRQGSTRMTRLPGKRLREHESCNYDMTGGVDQMPCREATFDASADIDVGALHDKDSRLGARQTKSGEAVRLYQIPARVRVSNTQCRW